MLFSSFACHTLIHFVFCMGFVVEQVKGRAKVGGERDRAREAIKIKRTDLTINQFIYINMLNEHKFP